LKLQIDQATSEVTLLGVASHQNWRSSGRTRDDARGLSAAMTAARETVLEPSFSCPGWAPSLSWSVISARSSPTSRIAGTSACSHPAPQGTPGLHPAPRDPARGRTLPIGYVFRQIEELRFRRVVQGVSRTPETSGAARDAGIRPAPQGTPAFRLL